MSKDLTNMDALVDVRLRDRETRTPDFIKHSTWYQPSSLNRIEQRLERLERRLGRVERSTLQVPVPNPCRSPSVVRPDSEASCASSVTMTAPYAEVPEELPDIDDADLNDLLSLEVEDIERVSNMDFQAPRCVTAPKPRRCLRNDLVPHS